MLLLLDLIVESHIFPITGFGNKVNTFFTLYNEVSGGNQNHSKFSAWTQRKAQCLMFTV